MAFYGNTFFSFKIHIIQHLVLHLPFRHGFGNGQQTVGKRTLSVVYMRNYAKIPVMIHGRKNNQKKRLFETQDARHKTQDKIIIINLAF